MNAHPNTEQLALHAVGDLPALATHVDACPPCRQIVAEFLRVHNFVVDVLPDPPTEDLLAVRRHVLANLQAKPKRVWWPAAAAAGLAACVLLSSLFRAVPLPEPPRPHPAISPPAPFAFATPVVAKAARARHLRPQAGLRSVTLLAETNEHPILKINTFDSNVVILWQSTERIQQQ